MITGKIKELLEKEVVALTTVSDDGRPNVIAVACCKVIEGNKVLVTDNFMNKTRQNLVSNQHVAMAVWSKDMENGYQLKGVAECITEGKYKELVDKDPNNKGLAHKAAVLVTVSEIWDLAQPRLIIKHNNS